MSPSDNINVVSPLFSYGLRLDMGSMVPAAPAAPTNTAEADSLSLMSVDAPAVPVAQMPKSLSVKMYPQDSKTQSGPNTGSGRRSTGSKCTIV